MANSKISALTFATTPLAGTEVLPIVQNGATVKVANNDLRPKQIQSNATSGVLQIAGPTAGNTRVMTTPDANFTAARTDAGQTFSGDQTFSTGNIVPGTAAKGINFTANTPASGMTSQLLNWYEEGTWTPTASSTVGAITTYASGGTYTRVGRQVTVTAYVDLTNVGTAAGSMLISNFPFKNGGASGAGYLQQMGIARETGVTGAAYLVLLAGNSTNGYITSLAGGAITWISAYQYALSITYYTA